MPSKPTCSQDTRDMIAGMRAAGHEWDVISTWTGLPIMKCRAIHKQIMEQQKDLELVVNQSLKPRPDYRKMGQHTGRD